MDPTRTIARGSARARILDATVRLIAHEGVHEVRIARIAIEAGVSSSLLHYHFASRDALLAEALERAYELAGDMRIGPEDGRAPATARLRAMIDRCLPAPGAQDDGGVLWAELWLHAARHPELRPLAARQHARLHARFAETIADGVERGELTVADVPRVADRLLALLDGYGLRALADDPATPVERAREAVWAAVAADLGVARG